MGVTWNGDAVHERYRKAAMSAMGDGLEDTLTAANVTVPHEEGVLEGTGTTDQDGLTGVISYDGPYAVEQHENPKLRHLGKGRYKWLELTFRERSSTILAFWAKRMARDL